MELRLLAVVCRLLALQRVVAHGSHNEHRHYHHDDHHHDHDQQTKQGHRSGSSASPTTLTQGSAERFCPSDAHQALVELKSIEECGIPAAPICVHPFEQDRIISGGIIKFGKWAIHADEHWRHAVLCDIVRSSHPGSWILDIGSNIGSFTLPLLAAGRNVVAVEATPTNEKMLRASYRQLRRLSTKGTARKIGRLFLINKAVTAPGMPASVCMGHQRKKGVGYLVEDNQGNMQVKAPGSDLCHVHVNASTIDDELHVWEQSLFRRQPGLASTTAWTPRVAQFAAVKVDIEGHEAEMIKGAKQVFCKYRPPLAFFEGRLGTGSWLDRFADDFAYQLNSSWSFASDATIHGPKVSGRLAHDVRLSPLNQSLAARCSSSHHTQ